MSVRAVAAIAALFAVFHGFAHAQGSVQQQPQAPKTVFTCESARAVGYHAGSTMPNVFESRLLFKIEEKRLNTGVFWDVYKREVGKNEWNWLGSMNSNFSEQQSTRGGMVGEAFTLNYDRTKFVYVEPSGFLAEGSPGTPYMVIGRCFPAP